MLNIKKSQISVTWIFAILLLCDPDGIQTHDLQNRNLTLYSAKLQGQRNSEVAATMALRANCIPKIECKITKKKLKRTIINLYIVNIKIF